MNNVFEFLLVMLKCSKVLKLIFWILKREFQMESERTVACLLEDYMGCRSSFALSTFKYLELHQPRTPNIDIHCLKCVYLYWVFEFITSSAQDKYTRIGKETETRPNSACSGRFFIHRPYPTNISLWWCDVSSVFFISEPAERKGREEKWENNQTRAIL